MISGKAAAYAIEAPTGWRLGRRGPTELVDVVAGDLGRILGTTPDVLSIDAKNLGEVERCLETEWAKDRALRLFIMLLDAEESDSGLDDAAALFERLLAHKHVLHHLENQFLQRPLPREAKTTRATTLVAQLPVASELLARIAERQPEIRLISDAFDKVDEARFGGSEQKADFRETAIATGAFRSLVLGKGPTGLSDACILEVHRSLWSVPEARAVVQAWTVALRQTAQTSRRMSLPEMEEPSEPDRAEYGSRTGAFERKRQVFEQQAAILEKVSVGDFPAARRFVAELEQRQLADGGNAYLAMSLTRLSQNAREMEAFDLALDWAFRATEIEPGDARTHTQLADALASAERTDEALREYSRAEELGERAYAMSGRARVMRLLGRHQEQLDLHAEASDLLEGSSDQIHSFVGCAVALSDLGRIDDALAHVTLAETRFPYDPLPRQTRGWMLVRQGRFEEAWKSFEEAEGFSGDKSAALIGLADICRRTGRLDEARSRYTGLIRHFPRLVDGYIGLIDTLRDVGDPRQAALYAAQTVRRFPGSPRAAGRHATTASEAGRHALAGNLFAEAIARFPRDVRLVSAQVTAIRREGKYDRALQVIDAALRRFPYSHRLQRTRAEMLRRLGAIADSRAAYQELIQQDAYDIRSRNGLATLLALSGRFEEAESLVCNDNPQTADEWRSFFITANCIERRGHSGFSHERLVWAHAKCPFSFERRMFAGALASYALRHGQARKAPRIETIPERDVANVIDFQVAAATRDRRAQRLYSMLSRNLPPGLLVVRDEIARNYGIVQDHPRHTKTWVGQRLNDELLLAAA